MEHEEPPAARVRADARPLLAGHLGVQRWARGVWNEHVSLILLAPARFPPSSGRVLSAPPQVPLPPYAPARASMSVSGCYDE